MMLCSKCRTENADDALFCEQCGARLELSCPACGAPINRGARFCRKCGTQVGGRSASAAEPVLPLTSPTDAEQSAMTATEGERKNITALFADIKGSMELMEDLDPEQAR